MARRPLSRRLRFEVFKRDGFACQYCGARAPDAVLHCDHIRPVSRGGPDELLNLVTACRDCNSGKGARLLDDRTAITRQRAQIEELAERRLQLEMMLAWRDEMAALKAGETAIVLKAIDAKSRHVPDEAAEARVRRWVARHGVAETLAALDEAFDFFFTTDDRAAWEKAFSRIGNMLSMRARERTEPAIRRLLYIQGILRNRFAGRRLNCVQLLQERLEDGFTLDTLERAAKEADDWASFGRLVQAGQRREQMNR